jgi:hypothetical protein
LKDSLYFTPAAKLNLSTIATHLKGQEGLFYARLSANFCKLLRVNKLEPNNTYKVTFFEKTITGISEVDVSFQYIVENLTPKKEALQILEIITRP